MASINRYFLHPFIFAIAWVLYYYNGNNKEVELFQTLRPILVLLVFTGAVFFTFNFFLKRSGKAAICATIFLLFFLAHQLLGAKFPGLFLAAGLNSLLVKAIIIMVIALIVWKFGEGYFVLNQFLFVVSLIWLFMQFGVIAQFYLKNTGRVHIQEESAIDRLLSGNRVIQNRPDIYYILMDKYGRSDVLKEHVGCDNGDFISFLKSMGFYVASKSRSNYRITPQSLASSLHMSYLQDFKDSSDKPLAYRAGRLYASVKNNFVVRSLKKLGYQYVHFNSGATITETNRLADVYIDHSSGVKEFEEVLVHRTALRELDFDLFNKNNRLRKIIIGNFKELEAFPKMSGPKFIFAHFMLPHPPHVFDGDGNPVSDKAANRKYDKERYCEYLQFGNQRLKKVLKAIVEESESPPVILLQSDHGAEFSGRGPFPNGLQMLEFYANLNAYLIPGLDEDNLYDTITPVNSFRLLFNQLFGTQFELLPDRSYYMWASSPDKFVSVPPETELNSGFPESNGAGDVWAKNLEAAIENDPDFYEAYAHLGIINMDNKKYKKAIEYFQKSIGIKPNYHFYVYFGMGDAYKILKMDKKYLDTHLKADEMFPNSWDVNSKLFLIYNASGDISNAIKYHLRAFKLSPEFQKLSWSEKNNIINQIKSKSAQAN